MYVPSDKPSLWILLHFADFLSSLDAIPLEKTQRMKKEKKKDTSKRLDAIRKARRRTVSDSCM